MFTLTFSPRSKFNINETSEPELIKGHHHYKCRQRFWTTETIPRAWAEPTHLRRAPRAQFILNYEMLLCVWCFSFTNGMLKRKYNAIQQSNSEVF